MSRQPEVIPLVDLVSQSRAIKEGVLRRMECVIEGGRYILGEEVAQFEAEFAAWCGVPHFVALANGTDALHLALRSVGIGPGDEVITAGNSFAATGFAIAYAGASPVFVDVDERDFNLDPQLVEDAITERTRAILPVHLYGLPARMTELSEIASRHGLYLIEDAAQAHGAEEAGRRCGSWGNLGCFSFYPGKNLGAFGDGGGVATASGELAEQLKLLRNYGQRVKNRHDLLGYNCRLDTLQACVLLEKMRYIDRWTEQRRQVADWYREELADTELILPIERAGA
ncbi:MAG: DegT/DnrJ/EryC1/StrS family aminotransferase, partial [Pirellulaceae bacterium]